MAHFTDLEPLTECAGELLTRRVRVVAPWHPHVDFRPSPNNLGDYLRNSGPGGDRGDPLAALAARKLLFSYNSTRSPRGHVAWLATIQVRYFSAVAALNLLAAAGVKVVRALGVDGGTAYANGFDRRDCLSNGRSSFDIQFTEMSKTTSRHGIDYRNLVEETP